MSVILLIHVEQQTKVIENSKRNEWVIMERVCVQHIIVLIEYWINFSNLDEKSYLTKKIVYVHQHILENTNNNENHSKNALNNTITRM